MVPRGEKLPPLPDQPPALVAPRDRKRPETLPGATNVTNYLDPASYSPDFEYLVPAWYDPPGTVHDGEPVDEVADLMKKEKFLCVGSARVTWDSSGTQGTAPGRQDGVDRAFCHRVCRRLQGPFLPAHGRLGCALRHDAGRSPRCRSPAGSGAR